MTPFTQPAPIDAVMVAVMTQQFFADIATEIRRPSYGEQAKSYATGLLKRAAEAGIYRPEESK